MSTVPARTAAAELWPQIGGIFAKRVADDIAVGSYAAVFDGGGEIVGGGFGHRRLNAPTPDADTIFRIASCTKSFTAAAVLLLRDRGLLELDAPITRFVPEFRGMMVARQSAVVRDAASSVCPPTVRMLLCMSGGLPTDDPWADRQESITNVGLREILRQGTPVSTTPGTAFEYSNLGYALLGQVIENVTGLSYIDVITREFLEPLDLTATSFNAPAAPAHRRATGYRRAGGAWIELPFSPPGAFSPIGGICTSARDLSRWSLWLAAAFDEDPVRETPLSASSRREMQQIQRAIPLKPGVDLDEGGAVDQPRVLENGYGFGLFVQRDDRHGLTVSHSGGCPGFSSNMRWNPRSGLGAVALENATYAGVGTPTSAALSMILDRVGFWPRPDPWRWTLDLRTGADRLIDSWDDELAERIMAGNVALDVPFTERAEAIAAAVRAIGGLTDGEGSERDPREPAPAMGSTPAHLIWYRSGCRGRLRCELRLAPIAPPAIQTFTVVAEASDLAVG